MRRERRAVLLTWRTIWHTLAAACVWAAGAVCEGSGVAQVQDSAQPRAIEYPWKPPHDDVRANLAIGSLRESMLTWLKTERGIHAETLLVSIGALAGFAAQNAVWERLRKRDIPVPNAAALSPEALSDYLRTNGLFVVAGTNTGEKFYFGDLINGYLVPQRTSTYPLSGFVAAAAVTAGAKFADMPDYGAMFRHVASTVGTPEFGVLRVAKDHQPQLNPRQALDLFWPRARYIFTRTDEPGPAKDHAVAPEHWPLITALVANQFVTATKDTLDPLVGVALIMEAAIAMSKVDPKSVPQTVPAPNQP
jgi:hypothetical protein